MGATGTAAAISKGGAIASGIIKGTAGAAGTIITSGTGGAVGTAKAAGTAVLKTVASTGAQVSSISKSVGTVAKALSTGQGKMAAKVALEAVKTTASVSPSTLPAKLASVGKDAALNQAKKRVKKALRQTTLATISEAAGSVGTAKAISEQAEKIIDKQDVNQDGRNTRNIIESALEQALKATGQDLQLDQVMNGFKKLNWQVHPVRKNRQIIGAILQKGEEFHIGIAPEFQGNWNYGQYINRFLKPILDQGKPVIVRNVDAKNSRAIRWLEKIGFETLKSTGDSITFILREKNV